MLGFLLWWNFTTPLEPILRKNAENCKAAGNARPARKTILCIFDFYPRRISFLNLGKSCFSGDTTDVNNEISVENIDFLLNLCYYVIIC